MLKRVARVVDVMSLRTNVPFEILEVVKVENNKVLYYQTQPC